MKLTVPHMGLLSVAYTEILRKHGVDMMPPPRPSVNTLNLGTRNSPEFACLPFKINLGNMIESLDNGADTILMPGGSGPCRFGYYGVVQEQILKSLGYEFNMTLTDNPDSLSGMVGTIRDISDIKDKKHAFTVFYLILIKMAALDKAQSMYHWYKPREINRNESDKAYSGAVRTIGKATTYRELYRSWKEVKKIFRDVKADMKHKPLKVGVLGEIFVVIEPFANMMFEKKLLDMGVEIVRGVWLSDWLNDRFRFKPFRKNQNKLAKKWAYPYLKYASGGESIESVGKTVKFSREGIDGVIHIMPFTCMPELVAATIMNRISTDMNYPVLSLTFDENVSEVNLQTRIEAFVDLLERRKKCWKVS
ncbi:2-hydroxyglutaryl-CoA dehydratase, D-component [bacterium BMS3Abin07]|nr:2-hydroxyglutaryl-CoA dehydratase, D-component [bacterium BMS3Abin07]GBE32768.1 2-hydroxyglutaryl-CoA dehydratase, D-component [bacterium BMS3Bbin05]HDL21318.1 CoA protein activase [Nitrospirota bacterium]HDO22381.1 CoA protein activase [Nitrospirota bacterium]HDZ87576.1 CoA protein activase [Nitrospirota bacterium]